MACPASRVTAAARYPPGQQDVRGDTSHDLRHAYATHRLASGIHPKIANERLGHSKVGITLDLYSYVIPGMQEDALAKLDAALKAAMAGKIR